MREVFDKEDVELILSIPVSNPETRLQDLAFLTEWFSFLQLTRPIIWKGKDR